MIAMSLEKAQEDHNEHGGSGSGDINITIDRLKGEMVDEREPPLLSKTERRRLAKKRKKEKLYRERSMASRKQQQQQQTGKDKHSASSVRITHEERKAKYTALAREKRDRKSMSKRFSDTVCFYCREKGHAALDCPQKKNDSVAVVGEIEGDKICYKCGSTEHALRDCHKFKKALAQLARQRNKVNAGKMGVTTAEKNLQEKDENEDDNNEESEPTLKAYVDLPYAKCFVCGEMGHLSSVCSKNSKGLYVDGGSCRYCQSKFHLAKDCPHHDGDDNNGEDDGVEVENMEQATGTDSFNSAGDDMPSTNKKNTATNKKRKVVKF